MCTPGSLTRRTFLGVLSATALPAAGGRTEVSIEGDEFYINGRPTYGGRRYEGHKIQGLLLNSRMVQGIFDDANPETVAKWAYPDTGRWDPERNTREFVEAMPEWRRHGLLSFTINLQGGPAVTDTWRPQAAHCHRTEPKGQAFASPQRGHRNPSGHRSRNRYSRQASSELKRASNSANVRG